MKYVSFSGLRWWRWMLSKNYGDSRIGIFRNLPHIKPGRCGFYIFGIEIGSRNPGDPVGLWLRRKGLWPW